MIHAAKPSTLPFVGDFFKVIHKCRVIEWFYDFPVFCIRMFIKKGIHPCYLLHKKKARGLSNTRSSSFSYSSLWLPSCDCLDPRLAIVSAQSIVPCSHLHRLSRRLYREIKPLLFLGAFLHEMQAAPASGVYPTPLSSYCLNVKPYLPAIHGQVGISLPQILTIL